MSSSSSTMIGVLAAEAVIAARGVRGSSSARSLSEIMAADLDFLDILPGITPPRRLP